MGPLSWGLKILETDSMFGRMEQLGIGQTGVLANQMSFSPRDTASILLVKGHGMLSNVILHLEATKITCVKLEQP